MNAAQKRIWLACAAVVSTISAFGESAKAGSTITWLGTDGANDYQFGDPNNWQGGVAPGTGDIADFAAEPTAFSGSQPYFYGADSVLGINIDNSGGFVWQINRSGTGAKTIQIGADGITLGGGGTTIFMPAFLYLGASQSWTVNGSTTVLNMSTGGPVADPTNGGYVISKYGTGTVILPDTSNTNTGGFEIYGGTLVDDRTTSGVGTGLVSVQNSGTFELQNVQATLPGGVTLYNGGTLAGTGTGAIYYSGTGNVAGPLTIDSTAEAIVTLSGVNSSDVLKVDVPFSGGSSSATIDFSGSGEVVLASGGGTYNGGYQVNSGSTVQVQNNNGLSTSASSGSNPTSSTGYPTVNMNGGTLLLSSANSSSLYNYGINVNLQANSTVSADHIGAANSGQVESNGSLIGARGVGTISLNGYTLNINADSTISGSSSLSTSAWFYAVGIDTGATAGGSGGINFTNVASGTWGLNAQSITGSGDFTKSGNGLMYVKLASTSFSGNVYATGGTLQGALVNSLGTGILNVSSGATIQFLGTGAISNSGIGGTGTITGGSVTLPSSASISPGTSTSRGILTDTITTLTLGTSNTLNFNITGTGTNPGFDYDQLSLGSGDTIASLSKGILDINFSSSLKESQVSGNSYTLVTATNDNFTGQAFSAINYYVNGVLATGVHGSPTYTTNAIKLSGITGLANGPTISLTSGGATQILPELLDSGTTAANATNYGKFGPSSSSNIIAVTGSHGIYAAGTVTGIGSSGSGDTSNYVKVGGFTPAGDSEIYLLKLDNNGAAISPTAGAAQIAALVSDINSANDAAFGLSTSSGPQLASALTQQLSGEFPTYDLMLTIPTAYIGSLTAGNPTQYDFGFDFTGYTNSSASLSNVTVTALAVVPEPASFAMLALGAVGGLGLRRSRKSRTA